MEIGRFFRKPSPEDLESVQPKYRRAIVQQHRRRKQPYVGAGRPEDLRFVTDDAGHTRLVAKPEVSPETIFEQGVGGTERLMDEADVQAMAAAGQDEIDVDVTAAQGLMRAAFGDRDPGTDPVQLSVEHWEVPVPTEE